MKKVNTMNLASYITFLVFYTFVLSRSNILQITKYFRSFGQVKAKEVFFMGQHSHIPQPKPVGTAFSLAITQGITEHL